MRSLLLTALLLAGCQTTWREGASVTSPSGQRLCAKHHIPLVKVRGYEPPAGRFATPNDDRPFYNIVGERSPNCIPVHQTLRRSDFARVPSAVTYCPACENELEEGLRVSDATAAVKFAKYALPIYGGGGIPTKGPYCTGVRDGVWTVSCFLVDGRRATIKISKEKGSVLDTHYRK